MIARTAILAAAFAAAAIPAHSQESGAAPEADIARLCGKDAACRTAQREAFAAFQARARADNATAPRAVKLVMFDCFLATGHGARIVESEENDTPIDWQAMLACYRKSRP